MEGVIEILTLNIYCNKVISCEIKSYILSNILELYKLSLILYEHELRGEHEASIRKRLVGQQEGSSKHGVWR